MTSILLNSGRRVDPFNLADTVVDLQELIPSLAKLCRYTGHTIKFYSVAEHTVHLIDAVPRALKRAAALHDMNEALTNDLPNPFKAALPDYVSFERQVQREIFRQFDEPWENMELLHSWDRRICADEMAQLFEPAFVVPGLTPLGVGVEGWEWRHAEDKLRASLTLLDLV